MQLDCIPASPSFLCSWVTIPRVLAAVAKIVTVSRLRLEPPRRDCTGAEVFVLADGTFRLMRDLTVDPPLEKTVPTVSGETCVPFSNRPLYLQVRDALAERIASGDLLPGSAIPSEGDLARQVGVSAGTVRKALQLMESERLIWRRQGRGTFVRDPSSHELAQRFIRLYGPDGTLICGQLKSTEVTRGAANATERDRLRLAAGAEVYRIRRVRHHEATPFSVEDATLPADLFPGLGENGQIADPIGALAPKYGILLGSAQERVSSAVPSAAVANALRTEPGVAVVVLDRVVFRIDDRRPVEWRVAHTHVRGSYYLAEIR